MYQMDAVPAVRIGTSGLCLREELLLMNMIRTSAPRYAQLQWQYVSDQACDVRIGGAPGTDSARFHVSVLRHGDMERQGLVLHLPLRLPAVETLLGQLQKHITAPQGGPLTRPQIPLPRETVRSQEALAVAAGAEVIRMRAPAESFADRLHRELQAGSQMIELVVPGRAPAVVIECAQRKYFLPAETTAAVNGEAWMTMLTDLTGCCEIRVAPLTSSARASSSPRRPLDRLLWRLGMITNDLLKSLPAQGQFQLRRWPDFGALGTQPRFIKLAAILVRKSLTIDELVAEAHIVREEVIHYLNACQLCGLLKITSSSAVLPMTRPTRAVSSDAGMRGLLGRIRSALHLG